MGQSMGVCSFCLSRDDGLETLDPESPNHKRPEEYFPLIATPRDDAELSARDAGNGHRSSLDVSRNASKDTTSSRNTSRISSTADRDLMTGTCSKRLSLTVEVHSARMSQSDMKIMKMNPYAIVRAGDEEMLRTNPHLKGHREPSWECKKTLERDDTDVPEVLEVAVYDKRSFRKDVLCGFVKVPCSAGSGPLFKAQNFTMELDGRVTGTVCVSVNVDDGSGSSPRNGLTRKRTSIGCEFDRFLETLETLPEEGEMKSTLNLSRTSSGHELAEDGRLTSSAISRARVRGPSFDFCANELLGTWTCVATRGLDEFLTISGVGLFPRKVALAAKWPVWQFAGDGDDIVFINHSAIGDIREDISFGAPYKFTDGKRNRWTSTARWTPCGNGGTLFIERTGELGSFSEERIVTDGRLEFRLFNPAFDASWGRSFVRESSG